MWWRRLTLRSSIPSTLTEGLQVKDLVERLVETPSNFEDLQQLDDVFPADGAGSIRFHDLLATGDS